MEQLIDIHCHILPGLDDGASNLVEAIALAELAVSEGIHTLIATPHYGNAGVWVEADTIRRSTQAFNKELANRGIPLHIVPGQEIRLTERLIDHWEEGKLLPLGQSSYVLIELPNSHVPKFTLTMFHELQVLGYRPIIAHPERNKDIAKNPELLLEMVEHGALAQLTAGSLTGLLGEPIRKLSLRLCKRNLIHFIASDAHHAINRPYAMHEALTILDKEWGRDYTSCIKDNAKLLIDNKSIQPFEPIRKQKSWHFLW